MTPTPAPEVVVPRDLLIRVRAALYEAERGVITSVGEALSEVAEALAASPQPVVAPSDLSGEDGLSKTIPSALTGDVAPQTVKFGLGKVVVDTGSYMQTPAVFICPVDVTGPLGSSARHLGHDRHTLLPGEIVLTFPHFDQAQAVADALVTPPAGPSA